MDLTKAKADIKAEDVDRIVEDIAEAKDAGYAQTVAESAKRRLRNTLVGASLARLIPTIEKLAASGGKSADGFVSASDDGKTISAEFRDAEGTPVYRAEIERTQTTSGSAKLDFSLSKLASSTCSYDQGVVSGGMFWMDRASREVTDMVVFAHANRAARLPDWFEFSGMAMASLPLSPEVEHLRIMDCWNNDSVLPLLAADGGLAGRNCLEMIETQEAAVTRMLLPWMAPLVFKVATKLRDSGFIWGQHFMAYNDTDIRCCAASVPGGIALFHENIDLIADHSQFVAVVGLNEDGRPKSFDLHALDRYADSPAALMANLMAGDAPIPQVSLDLVSGELALRTPIDVTQIGEYLHCAVEGDIDAIEEWISGDREYKHAKTNFEDFEPSHEGDDDEFDDEEDETVLPAP